MESVDEHSLSIPNRKVEIFRFSDHPSAQEMIDQLHFYGINASLVIEDSRFLVHAYPSYRSSL